jgi:hypothetical protein
MLVATWCFMTWCIRPSTTNNVPTLNGELLLRLPATPRIPAPGRTCCTNLVTDNKTGVADLKTEGTLVGFLIVKVNPSSSCSFVKCIIHYIIHYIIIIAIRQMQNIHVVTTVSISCRVGPGWPSQMLGETSPKHKCKAKRSAAQSI